MRAFAVFLMCAVAAGLGYFGYAANIRYMEMQAHVETSRAQINQLSHKIEMLEKDLHQAELDHERVVSELETKLGDVVKEREALKTERDFLLNRLGEQMAAVLQKLDAKDAIQTVAPDSTRSKHSAPPIKGLERAITPEEEARMLNELDATTP
ncbi:hypothetical protein [Desulfovibrio inopinatus]|uniref:hypothetical protein n=1 Tax=Desulfovibrio inopinatus TaxID=102109 RepID=UPI00042A5E30|nr:hypothetical protein [Desulfovibrio inopinatus]